MVVTVRRFSTSGTIIFNGRCNDGLLLGRATPPPLMYTKICTYLYIYMNIYLTRYRRPHWNSPSAISVALLRSPPPPLTISGEILRAIAFCCVCQQRSAAVCQSYVVRVRVGTFLRLRACAFDNLFRRRWYTALADSRTSGTAITQPNAVTASEVSLSAPDSTRLPPCAVCRSSTTMVWKKNASRPTMHTSRWVSAVPNRFAGRTTETTTFASAWTPDMHAHNTYSVKLMTNRVGVLLSNDLVCQQFFPLSRLRSLPNFSHIYMPTAEVIDVTISCAPYSCDRVQQVHETGLWRHQFTGSSPDGERLHRRRWRQVLRSQLVAGSRRLRGVHSGRQARLLWWYPIPEAIVSAVFCAARYYVTINGYSIRMGVILTRSCARKTFF